MRFDVIVAASTDRHTLLLVHQPLPVSLSLMVPVYGGILAPWHLAKWIFCEKLLFLGKILFSILANSFVATGLKPRFPVERFPRLQSLAAFEWRSFHS